jgi:hypothetical protein
MQHSEMTLFPGQPMRIYEVPPSVTAPDSSWLVQFKKNGHRAIVRCDEAGRVVMIDRHGKGELAASKKGEWQWLADVFAPPFVLDGELVGPRQAGSKNWSLALWDAISMAGCSWAEIRYLDRLRMLKEPIPRSQGTVHIVGWMFEPAGWRNIWDSITDPDGEDEGLVFKRWDIPLAWHTRPGVEDPNQLKLRKKG